MTKPEPEMEIVSRYRRQAGPLDVVGLIRSLGLEYVKVPMPDECSGRIDRMGDKYVITVNANEGIQRRRFTAAHELAHYLLHRDLLEDGHLDRLFGVAAANNPSAPLTPKHEVQANQLAAELLMPAKQIRAAYENGETDARVLAARYQVSPAAMAIRLKNLGLT